MTELEGNRKELKCQTCEACPWWDMIWLLHFFFSSFPLPTTFYSNFISKTHLQVLIMHPFAKLSSRMENGLHLHPREYPQKPSKSKAALLGLWKKKKKI